MTTTIKKGQKVWWDDPVQGKSGEYDVLAVDHTRNIVQIGDGEQTFELSPEHLEITCPVSEEDRQQVDKLKEHYRTLGKQGLELIRDIVSRFDEEEFSVDIPYRFATRIAILVMFTGSRSKTGSCVPHWITTAVTFVKCLSTVCVSERSSMRFVN